MPFTRFFPGSATLDDTRRACKVEEQDETANLTKLEPVVLKKDDGTKTEVNQADFVEVEDVLQVRELKFVDVSTTQGTATALALNSTHKRIYQGKLFVKNKLKDVEVFRKK